MVSRFAGIDIPLDVGEFQLIDRKVLVALLQHEDYYPYIRGMIANCGFRTKGVPYVWRARRKGLSKNRLYNLVDQGLNGLISFTNLPMRIAMFAGFAIALLSFVYAAFTIVANLVAHGDPHAGPASPPSSSRSSSSAACSSCSSASSAST